jgi:hypothetical protein
LLLQRLNDAWGPYAKNPSATISLVGSSENGPQMDWQWLNQLKHIWLILFAIDESRIKLKVQTNPICPFFTANLVEH